MEGAVTDRLARQGMVVVRGQEVFLLLWSKLDAPSSFHFPIIPSTVAAYVPMRI